MTWLVMGLMLFLGIHSIRIFFDDWRTEQLDRLGATRWKAAYSLASLAGLGLIVLGYSQARALSAHAWRGDHLLAACCAVEHACLAFLVSLFNAGLHG